MLGRLRGRARRAPCGAERGSARGSPVVLGLVLVVLAAVAPAAGANYARVEASVGCDRVVTWRGERLERRRPRSSARTSGCAVRVPPGRRRRSMDGPPARRAASPPTTTTASPGSFELPDGVDAVELRVTARSPWGAERRRRCTRAIRGSRSAELPAGVRGPAARRPASGSTARPARSRSGPRNVGRGPPDAPRSSSTASIVRSVDLAAGAAEDARRTGARRQADADRRCAPTTRGAPSRSRAPTARSTGPTAVVVERCGAPTRSGWSCWPAAGGATVDAEVGVRGTTVANRRRSNRAPCCSAPWSCRRRHCRSRCGSTTRWRRRGSTGAATDRSPGSCGCGTAGRPRATCPRPPPDGAATLPRRHLRRSRSRATDRPCPARAAHSAPSRLLLGGALLLGGGVALAARDRRRPTPVGAGHRTGAVPPTVVGRPLIERREAALIAPCGGFVPSVTRR